MHPIPSCIGSQKSISGITTGVVLEVEVVVSQFVFFFSSRRRHTRCSRDWSSDVCSSDLKKFALVAHDWDGYIAWALAIAYPDVLRRLVIINAPHPAVFARLLRSDPMQQKEIGRASCRERV